MLGDVKVPLGKPVPSKVSQTTLLYNEFIVYDIAQVFNNSSTCFFVKKRTIIVLTAVLFFFRFFLGQHKIFVANEVQLQISV